MLRPGPKALELIRRFEVCRLQAYPDADGWSIGWGHHSGVKEGDTCTQGEADTWLMEDAQIAADAVAKWACVALTPNQADALIDFTYNLGAGDLEHSTLLRKLNAGDYAGAADEFPRWNHSRGVVLAELTERRAAERSLFLDQENT